MNFKEAIDSLAVPTRLGRIVWQTEHAAEYVGKIKVIDLPDAMKALFKKELGAVRKEEVELKIFCPVNKIFHWFFGAAWIIMNGHPRFARGNAEKLAIYRLEKTIQKQTGK